MTPIEIALLCLVVFAGGVVLWLFAGRARHAAEVASSIAARQIAEAEIERTRAELASLRTNLDETTNVVRVRESELAGISAQLGAELGAERRARSEDRVEHETRLADARRSFEERSEEVRRQAADFERVTRERFAAMASEILKSNSQELLKLAGERFDGQMARLKNESDAGKKDVQSLVQPLSDSLKQTNERLAAIGREWSGEKSAIDERLKGVIESSASLKLETTRLTQALSKPQVRGRYGELQLKRVVEISGMQEYCDFTLQEHRYDSEGKALRPDMLVNLPGGRQIVVDSKANIDAYMSAIEATTEVDREALLEKFATHVSDQAIALGKKKYWSEFDGSPEFVVMFVPGDQFIDAALARKPELLEIAARSNVILASPSTLIGLLRAVAVAFREQKLAAQASELLELGKTLHERAAVAFEHAMRVGSALASATEKYNAFVASYQTRLEPALRQFEGAGVKSAKELPDVEVVSVVPRLTEG